jgi:hypothetical protein
MPVPGGGMKFERIGPPARAFAAGLGVASAMFERNRLSNPFSELLTGRLLEERRIFPQAGEIALAACQARGVSS